MTFSWRRLTFFGLLLVVAIVALTLTIVNRDASPGRLVALGDSYASGEGLAPYEAGTDTADNRCHRSINDAYSVTAAKTLGVKVVDESCSGATTETMLNGGAGRPSQLTDLKQAKYVTVTIGGNDINALSAVLSVPSVDQLQTQLASLRPKLVDAFTKVKMAAPKDAHVAATGYPDIIPDAVSSDCFLDQSAAAALNGELSLLNAAIKGAASDARIEFVDLSSSLNGHELCTGQPWINGITLANFSASLHPTADGQKAMGQAVAAALKP